MASVRNTGKGAVMPRDSSSNRLKQFLEETWVELRYKVTWPNPRTELIRTTLVVLTVVILMSVFIYVLDMIFAFILSHTILAPH
jgi:preprotein translocase SecE subunit